MTLLSSLFQNFFVLFLILAFVTVVLMLQGVFQIWTTYKGPQAKKIEQRLQALTAGAGSTSEETTVIKQRLLNEAPPLQRWLLGMPRIQQLDRFLEQSGLAWSVSKLIGLSLLAAGLALGMALLLALPRAMAFAAGLAAASLPFLYVRRCRFLRTRKIERQLPDALDLIKRALRAGHAFSSGLQMVGEEMQEPIAGEFRITHDEVNFGVNLHQALTNLAARVPSTDLRYFVIAVLIQRETGGNLAELLDNLAKLIRERLQLLEKVQVLAAEGKLSAWILGILPFAMAGIINLINPAFMAVLWTDSIGVKMVEGALVMMFLGVLAMRKVIRVHV